MTTSNSAAEITPAPRSFGPGAASPAVIVIAGALAGPVAGGQLTLLAKPLGGVLGIPGAVVGYVALTVLVTACVTALLAVRRPVSNLGAGVCAVVTGAGFALAGATGTPWLFVTAVVIAGACAGPLIVTGRAVAFERAGGLALWQIAMAAGVPVAAGAASLCYQRPGVALVSTGAVLVPAGAVLVMLRSARAQRGSLAVAKGTLPRHCLIGYSTIGLILGGAVLPALHLLLFRWNALGAEQTDLLLLATIPAIAVLVFPGPHPSAVVPLLILAAGGPVLMATAPGRTTLTVGLAVTLTACARAARGLDLVVRSENARSRRIAALTVLTVVGAGVLGLALITALGQICGAGTALTALAIPAGALAALCGPPAPARVAHSALIAKVLEGDAQ